MSYVLGIDIGTTFTAAAILRNGHAQVVTLGDQADTIPSVVLAREDATILIGEAALRRGVREPHRLGREFKRRFGQPEPLVLGGAPYSPEALTALLLRFVVDAVVAREGERPTRICLTHPANWGPFKVDLFQHQPARPNRSRSANCGHMTGLVLPTSRGWKFCRQVPTTLPSAPGTKTGT